MKSPRHLLLITTLLLPACATLPTTTQPLTSSPATAPVNPTLTPAGPGWKPLLTTLDPAAWDFEPEFWKLEPDGTLHGAYAGGPLHHFMFSKADFANFELHADFKMTGYNSGICIRLHPTSFDHAPGYQIDMGDGYWGSLFEEKGRGIVARFPKDQVESTLHRDDWNHYYLLAKDHHITIYLNGTKTVDVEDAPGPLTGKLGFQLTHSKATDVQFKNLMIRPL